MALPIPPAWKFVAVSDGSDPVRIGGIDVWKQEKEWRYTNHRVTVNDPLHDLQEVTFHVFETGGPDVAMIKFGFTELTPGVYGFWIPNQPDQTDRR
jgi:hypothetical protein